MVPSPRDCISRSNAHRKKRPIEFMEIFMTPVSANVADFHLNIAETKTKRISMTEMRTCASYELFA